MLLLLSTAGELRSLTCVTFLSLAPLWMSANRAFLPPPPPPPPPPDWSLKGSNGHCHIGRQKRPLIYCVQYVFCKGPLQDTNCSTDYFKHEFIMYMVLIKTTNRVLAPRSAFHFHMILN